MMVEWKIGKKEQPAFKQEIRDSLHSVEKEATETSFLSLIDSPQKLETIEEEFQVGKLPERITHSNSSGLLFSQSGGISNENLSGVTKSADDERKPPTGSIKDKQKKKF